MAFERGDRVEFISSNDPTTELRQGDLGTVSRIDSLGTIHVLWDSGSGLGIIKNEGDRIRLVAKKSAMEALKKARESNDRTIGS